LEEAVMCARVVLLTAKYRGSAGKSQPAGTKRKG
jgi:hypothetical protein